MHPVQQCVPLDRPSENVFYPEGGLRAIMKTQGGEMLQECNQSNYISNQLRILSAHMVTHSGVKSFKCSQCEFTSYQSGNLRTHVKRTHNIKYI